MSTRYGDLQRLIPKLSAKVLTWYLPDDPVAVGDQQGPTFVVPASGPSYRVAALVAYAETAPTDADLEIDIRDDGATILSADAAIAATENSVEVTSFANSPQIVAPGSVLVLDVNQVGSTEPGEFLSVHLYLEPIIGSGSG